MATRFVRVRLDRPDGTSFVTTVTAEHAAALDLKRVGGRATSADGTPMPAKQVEPLGAPTAPAGGTETDPTEE